jgi:hypothetical protein
MVGRDETAAHRTAKPALICVVPSMARRPAQRQGVALMPGRRRREAPGPSQVMAAVCDFRYEQLCGKQAGLDQLAGCYRALLDRDRPRARQADAGPAPHRA